MAFIKLSGNDTEDKTQGRAAYGDAMLKSLEAVSAFPQLNEAPHTDVVNDVHQEVLLQTGFVVGRRNFYINHRVKVAGDINGPATALKFDLRGQANWTIADSQNLYNHLTAAFSNAVINVASNPNRPVFVVHIGL